MGNLCGANDLLIIDYASIIELCEINILKGDTCAMRALAIIYQDNKYPGKDIQKAFDLLEMAIKKGDSYAMNMLACSYK